MVDVMPTMLGSARAKGSSDHPFDGKDIWPTLVGGKSSPQVPTEHVQRDADRHTTEPGDDEAPEDLIHRRLPPLDGRPDASSQQLRGGAARPPRSQGIRAYTPSSA